MNALNKVKNGGHRYQMSQLPPRPKKSTLTKHASTPSVDLYNMYRNANNEIPPHFTQKVTPLLKSKCGNWVSKNVTKEFTSSFILQTMP